MSQANDVAAPSTRTAATLVRGRKRSAETPHVQACAPGRNSAISESWTQTRYPRVDPGLELPEVGPDVHTAARACGLQLRLSSQWLLDLATCRILWRDTSAERKGSRPPRGSAARVVAA